MQSRQPSGRSSASSRPSAMSCSRCWRTRGASWQTRTRPPALRLLRQRRQRQRWWLAPTTQRRLAKWPWWRSRPRNARARASQRQRRRRALQRRRRARPRQLQSSCGRSATRYMRRCQTRRRAAGKLRRSWSSWRRAARRGVASWSASLPDMQSVRTPAPRRCWRLSGVRLWRKHRVPMRCRKPLRRWLRRRVERQSWRLSCRRSRQAAPSCRACSTCPRCRRKRMCCKASA
mmetsp:Transcript_2399/g.6404  ORF Transcript_2399/g.6404 Transcript_2399/m.6404 type:complete len:232 (+) Transcript_2399:132-827(+)